MSIYFSGTFTRSSGVASAIAKQVKLVNLKPVKKIQIQFDPFHPNSKHIRDLMFNITNPKVTNTNLNCIIKTNVVCDRSEPFVNVDLIEKKSIKFLAGDLTCLEILKSFNEEISSKVEVETEVTPLVNKLEKKKTKKK